MGSFFDLIAMRSYKITGENAKRYAFYKDKPVYVENKQDIQKFRMYNDIFFECDENGNRILNIVNEPKQKVRSFSKFNPLIKNQEDIINDLERAKTVKVPSKTAEELNKILELAKQDSFKNNDEEVKEEVKEKLKKQIKKQKNNKDNKPENPLQCKLCGKICLTDDEFNDHLKDHDEED